jgi:glycosyltransferase involved in cell wall biosynthesis
MVTTFYPPYNFGGDGLFVQRLARALVKDGNEVHVIHDRDAYAFCAGESGATANSAKVSPQNDGVHLHTMGDGNPNAVDLLISHQLGRPVKREDELRSVLTEKFDVIHFHNVSLLGGPGVLKYGSGVKVCTLHDHWFVCAMHVLWRYGREACTKRTCMSCTVAGARPPQLWRYTGAVEEAVTEVDTFISPTEFARQSHYRNGFPGKITVLPHFVPDEFIAAAGEKQSLAVHPRPYFLVAGRLEKLKGVQILIDQFRRYRSADLLIAGTGDYERELKAQAHDLPHVRFVGRVLARELNVLYRNAIAVVIPSLVYETFGLVALEAFAQSTPVLVNNIGALPEIVAGGGGFVYNTGLELTDWMEKLRTDPLLRNELGQRGLDNLKSNYTEQRHLTQYYGMISELRNPKIMQEVR